MEVRSKDKAGGGEVCGGSCRCALTHRSPEAACVRAAAPQVQAGAGSSQ